MRNLNFRVLQGLTVALLVTFASMSPGSVVVAQGAFDLGATTTSRYVWRGIQMDNGVNIQPYAMYYTDKFSVGASSSVSLTNDFNEISLWVSYTLNTSLVDMTFFVYDYYYEYPGSDFLNYKGAGEDASVGMHFIETYVEFSSENSPLSFKLSSVVWNDPDNSLYAEASYSRELEGNISSKFSIGSSLKESREWYYTNKTGIVNLSYELTKSVKINQDFQIPMSVNTIFNPYGRAFYVVLSLSL